MVLKLVLPTMLQVFYFLLKVCVYSETKSLILSNQTIGTHFVAYCTGLLLARRVLKLRDLDKEYEGNVEVKFKHKNFYF